MGKSIHTEDIIKEVAYLNKMSKEEVSYVVESFLDVIKNHLLTKHAVDIRGIAKFTPATIGPFRSNLMPEYFIKQHIIIRAKVSPKINNYLKRGSSIKEK